VVAARRWAALAGLCLSLSGCLLVRAVTTPVKVAATAVVAAGDASVAVISTTADVTTRVVRATGSAAGSGVDSAAQLAKAGTVTFVDAATGRVERIPWRKDLTLAAGAASAKVRLGTHAVEVIRGGKIAITAARDLLPLLSGDVVRLR
jgi:hypothetical protein